MLAFVSDLTFYDEAKYGRNTGKNRKVTERYYRLIVYSVKKHDFILFK